MKNRIDQVRIRLPMLSLVHIKYTSTLGMVISHLWQVFDLNTLFKGLFLVIVTGIELGRRKNTCIGPFDEYQYD